MPDWSVEKLILLVRTLSMAPKVGADVVHQDVKATIKVDAIASTSVRRPSSVLTSASMQW